MTGATYTYQTNEAQTYDANGNRTAAGYVTVVNNQTTSDGTYTYEYDAEGNRTKRTEIATGAVSEYNWDHHNRLTAITERASLTGPITARFEYTYDALNRRIAKSLDTNGDGTVDERTYFVTEGLRTSRGNAGDRVVVTLDAIGAVTHRYLHGPMVDQILADEDFDAPTGTSALRWPLTDNQGTTRDVAEYNDAIGITAIANHLTYNAFGQVTSESNPAVDQLFTYIGREFDKESGLLYLRARVYDPDLGQFLGEDPEGFGPGDPNVRRYVGNNAANATDPSGLEPVGKAATKIVSREVTQQIVSRILARLVRRGFIQEHHILQQVVFKIDTQLGKWLTSLVCKDVSQNLIYLPTLKSGGKRLAEHALAKIEAGVAAGKVTRALAEFAKRTGHEGKHLGAYLRSQQQRLFDIMARHTAGLIDDAAAQAEIGTLQAEIRLGLETGAIVLQKAESAALKKGAVVSFGGLAILIGMSEDAHAAKVQKFEDYVHHLINGGVTEGFSVADHFPGAAWLDWGNPLDLYRSADKIGRAMSIENDPQIRKHLEDVAKYLGLVPSEERVAARTRATAILDGADRITQADIDFLKSVDHHLGGLETVTQRPDGRRFRIRFGPEEERAGPAVEEIK